jgi:hypothetical protein
MPNDLLRTALQYAERGFSIIPIKPDIDPEKNKALKKPYLFSWIEYQKRRATPDEIRQWWQKWPKAMIGIVTGEISGVFVIDCDTKEGYEAIQNLLPDSLITPIARSPRGWHLYFHYTKDCKLTNQTRIIPGVDSRGDGGYIVAPPSRNDNGEAYAW